MQYKFDYRFLVVSLTALAVGLAIFFFAEGFVRGYLGDVVVIIFLYSLLSTFLKTKMIYRAGIIFSLAVIIEILQAIISLPANPITDLILGGYFDLLDLVAYLIGLIFALTLELMMKNNR